MGPRRLETNRSVRPPAKRDRIFFETRTTLFDSPTNHIDGDLNVFSSEKSAPFVADLRPRCAGSAHLQDLERGCAAFRVTFNLAGRERGSMRGDFGRMQTAGG